MIRSVVQVLGIIGIAALQPGSAALAEAPQSSEKIVSCVAANVPAGDELRSITLKTTDRAGVESTIRADVLGRSASGGLRTTLVMFKGSADLGGAAVLIIESEGGTELWVHARDLGRRRVEVQGQQGQNLFGTGLSYEDLTQLLAFVRTQAGQQRYLGDGRIGDRSIYLLESEPTPGTSAYERILTSVDQETCVPLEMKLYERTGASPRKVLATDPEQIFRVRSTWIAHSATLVDHRDEKRTVLEVESVVPDLELPDEAFTSDGLGNYELKIEFDEVKLDLI